MNKNDKGKTMKEHHASSVLFVETEGMLDLIVHLPKKKEYKCAALSVTCRWDHAARHTPKRSRGQSGPATVDKMSL